tara:strand:- start:4535 stop:5536 length:1002 start_codon:yes stop_codon:yes gene_type:complete
MNNSNNTNLIKSLSNKKIIVTGGTGLIGRQIINLLTKINCKVTSVSLDNLELNKNCNYIYGDLTNYNFCKKITKGFDFAIHTAGIKGSVDVTKNKPASFFVPMLMMNTNFLEACRINKVKKIVFTSSIGAYSVNEILKEKNEFETTPPMDSYPGWVKRMGELQIKAYYKQYNTNSFVIVRPANVYGPGDNFDPNNAMVIPSLINKILNGDNPLKVWGDGSAIRDFIHSKDVAYGTILALIKGQNSHYYNLGSGKGVSIKKLVETLNQILDFNYEFDLTKPSGAQKRIMDITKAKQEFDFNTKTDLKNGLKETIEWYKNNKSDHLKKQNYFNNG